MQGHEIMYSLIWYKNYVRSTDIVRIYILSLKHEIIVFCGLYKHYRCRCTVPNGSPIL